MKQIIQLLAFGLITASPRSAEPAKRPPNIMVIPIDDMSSL